MDARERARQARAKIDAERDERDRRIEDVAARYFTASDEHGDLTASLVAVEGRMHTVVRELLALGESQARVAGLLGMEPREVRRIRGAAGDGERAGGDQTDPTGDDSDSGPQADAQSDQAQTGVHNEPAPAGTDRQG